MNLQIYEEASEWVVRHRTEELGAGARREFDAWLRGSPQHVRAYLEMSSIWEELPALDPTSNPSADELVADARAESNVHALVSRGAPHLSDTNLETLRRSESKSSRERVKAGGAWQRPGQIAALAASLMLAVGIASWLFFQRDIYSTGIGEQRTLLLADGSRVELNARSRIRIRFTQGERGIELLSGEALFKVAKDHNRPFIVTSDDARVRAVGTQFDVYRKLAGTVVSVLEGRVAVRTSSSVTIDAEGIPATTHGRDTGARTNDPFIPGTSSTRHHGGGTRKGFVGTGPGRGALQPYVDEVLVEAGEQLFVAQVSNIDGKRLQSAPDAHKTAGTDVVQAATAWTQQRLVFNASPLTEVAEEFNRYNRRSLVVDDATLKNFHISGNFSSTDPTLLIRFLRAQPEIVVKETADEIRISRRSSSI